MFLITQSLSAADAPVKTGKHDKSIYSTNPVLSALMTDVVFWVNFDKSAEPVMGKPNEDPDQTVKKEYFDAPGLVGKAFLNKEGNFCRYPAAGNLDFSKPGGLSFWVSPVEWTWGDEQPLNNFFMTPWRAQGGYLGIERQGWQKKEGVMKQLDSVLFYIEGFPDINKPGIQTIGLANAPQAEWANGRWHFFVFNWKGSLLEMSMDGSPFRSLDIGHSLAPDAVDEFRVGINVEPTLMDEFMIYRRPLKEEEVSGVFKALNGAQK
ncbi:MAG: hypothetical protein HY360_13170 [Verrucomicrobia bacterium]|nr:hypothetical protein [Verrucomicrobiota bacterium]